MPTSFTLKTKNLIKKIPQGKVATYGWIAAMAGNPRGARQVARILHSCSRKDNLPWHRIINQKGRISLKHDDGYALQKQLLEKEGIVFDATDTICLKTFLWMPAIPFRS